MDYYLPNPPKLLLDKFIQQEIDANNLQLEYFSKRKVSGPLIVPNVYQPVFEPSAGYLIAIFHEPGAVHLVFNDEVAPAKLWDEKWREERKRLYGRTADVESVEIVDPSHAFFEAAGCFPQQPYELPPHLTIIEDYHGNIYTNSWNHDMSCNTDILIEVRGGYAKKIAPVYNGSRVEAENYAESI